MMKSLLPGKQALWRFPVFLLSDECKRASFSESLTNYFPFEVFDDWR